MPNFFILSKSNSIPLKRIRIITGTLLLISFISLLSNVGGFFGLFVFF